MGLKTAALIRSWANSGQKTQRPKNLAATSEEPGAKTGCWEQKRIPYHHALLQAFNEIPSLNAREESFITF